MRLSAFILLAIPGVSSFTFSFSTKRNVADKQELSRGHTLANANVNPMQALFLPSFQRSQQRLQPNGRRQNNFLLWMAVPILENWSITTRGEASGVVNGHPDPGIFDGELLTTSKLATRKGECKEGSTIVTASGSKYKLGAAKKAFKGISFGTNNNGATASKPKPAPRNTFGGWGRGAASKTPVLDDWRVTIRGEVKGTVSSHPDASIENGDVLTTSKIVEDRNTIVEGQTITTASGSKYTLGKKSSKNSLFSGATTPSAVSKGGTFTSGSNSLPTRETLIPSPSSKPSSDQKPFNPFGTFEMLGKSGSKQIAKTLSSFSIANENKQNTSPAATTNSRARPGSSTSNAISVRQEAERIANLRDLKIKYGVNGKTVGDGKYLLCDKPQRSTSGKSNIWSAYRADSKGLPTGEKLTIKISNNYDAICRESDNYNRVTSGLFPGRFVEKSEFLPSTGGAPSTEFKSSCALVIESGRKDLKAILVERGGRGFEGRAMRDAASAALQCIQAMHSSGIVWTDLKTENFVIVSDEIGDNGFLPGVKGIDLESAMKRGSNPVDFSPEACPPEFASAFIAGEGLNFKLDYSYDMWSYGMMLYELTTGRSYFGNKTPAQITKSLQYGTFEADVSLVSDPKLRELISLCLQADPKKRPGISQMLFHPYFLSSGFGPFGF